MFNILVVDDDKNTRLLLKTLFEAERYTVFTAENGLEALKFMDEEHVDQALERGRRGLGRRPHDAAAPAFQMLFDGFSHVFTLPCPDAAILPHPPFKGNT